jgi:curved DNA-binding protein CbpA
MADYIDDDNLWKEDLFATLGVSNDASDSELKKSYLKLAKKYHPDRFVEENQEKRDAQKLFSKITVAYNTLIDPQKKAHYLDLRRLLASHLPENQTTISTVTNSSTEIKQNSTSSSSSQQIKEDKTAPKAPDISADKLREEQARSLYELGLSEIKKKKIDKAVEYFQQAIAVKNDIAEFHSQLGLAYKSKNWESMAQAEFKLALKFNPRDKIASTNAIPDKPKKEEKKGLFGGLFNFGKKK